MFSCNVLYVKELNINKNNDFNLISANCGLMEYDELSNSYTILSFDNKNYNIELEWYNNLNSRKRIPQNSDDLQKYLLCEDNDFIPPHAIKINTLNIKLLKLPLCIIMDCITSHGSILNKIDIYYHTDYILINMENITTKCVLLLNEFKSFIISESFLNEKNNQITLYDLYLIHGIIDNNNKLKHDYNSYEFYNNNTIVKFNNSIDLFNHKLLYSNFIIKKLNNIKMPLNHVRILNFKYNFPILYKYLDNPTIYKPKQYLNHNDILETILSSHVNEKNILLYLSDYVSNINYNFNNLLV